MATLRKAVLATAMLSTGLFGSTGMAMADAHDAGTHSDTQSQNDGRTSQDGFVNSKKVAPNTSPDVCNNNVPVNVLGVQVPLQDVTPGVSALDRNGDGSASPGTAKGCSSPSAS